MKQPAEPPTRADISAAAEQVKSNQLLKMESRDCPNEVKKLASPKQGKKT